MGKRGATSTAGAKAKARKAEPEAEECAPVSELLAAAGLPESTADMLRAMAPFSLKAAQGERHEYQERMNDILSTLFAGLKESREAAVAEIEGQIAQAQKDKEGGSSVVDAAAEKEAAEIAVRDAKAKANEEAEKEAEAAQETLAAAQEKVAGFDAEQRAVAEEKDTYVAIAGETMEKLKAGNYPGKLWRERDRSIGEVSKVLETLSPDEASLRNAFGAALKLKPEARGAFAAKAIDYAEALLAKQVNELTEKLASGEAEKAGRAHAAVAAEAALKAAQARRDQSQEEYISADNTLLEATEAKNAAVRAVEEFEPRMAELSKSLGAAQAGLSQVTSLITSFEALRTGAPAPTEEAAEEKAVEEPTAMPVEQVAA